MFALASLHVIATEHFYNSDYLLQIKLGLLFDKFENIYHLPKSEKKHITSNHEKLIEHFLPQPSPVLIYPVFDINNNGNLHAIEDFRDISCAICLAELDHEDNLFRTPCGHYFHIKCIRNLFKHKHASKCPTCQYDLSQLSHIFIRKSDAHEQLKRAIRNKQYKIVDMLITSEMVTAISVLELLSLNNATEVFQQLLNRNILDGNRLLCQAASTNLEKCIPFLLRSGISPNITDDLGNTPLHLSATSGATNISFILIQHGAFLSATNNEGVTPLECAGANCNLHTSSLINAALEHEQSGNNIHNFEYYRPQGSGWSRDDAIVCSFCTFWCSILIFIAIVLVIYKG